MIYQKPLEFKSFEERQDYLYGNYISVLGDDILDKLVQDGFLVAPASTRYHGSYEGGLFDHCANVALILQLLTEDNRLKWNGDEYSPMRVGILHDLCKIDQYTRAKDNQELWEYTDTLVTGHGTKSVIYAYELGVRLTEEERACILYHMGAYTPPEEWKNLRNAIKTYPNVLWTHTADMIASQIMGV